MIRPARRVSIRKNRRTQTWEIRQGREVIGVCTSYPEALLTFEALEFAASILDRCSR